MNSRQQRTLTAIFAEPTSPSIDWAAIESLFSAVDCKTIEGNGSRVRFVRGTDGESFHRPHPEKEAKRYQVRAAALFLTRLGVKP